MQRILCRQLKPFFFVLIALCGFIPWIQAVDRHKFRTCEKTLFCKTYRHTDNIMNYNVDTDSVIITPNKVTFNLRNQNENVQDVLVATLGFVMQKEESPNPVVHLHIVEKLSDPNDPKRRWENTDVLTDEAQILRGIALVSEAESGLTFPASDTKSQLLFQATDAMEHIVLVLKTSPFALDVYFNYIKLISLNDDHRFHYEVRRDRVIDDESTNNGNEVDKVEDIHQGKTIVDYGEDGLAIYSDGTVQQRESEIKTVNENTATKTKRDSANDGWEETFGGHMDKKKFGPSSLGMDITFYGSETSFYGLAEHATDFALKDTLQHDKVTPISDPYRLYNLDVFEYEVDEVMALYGSIPVLMAANFQQSAGMFWHNPTETFVDIYSSSDKTKKTSHWMSESGVIDLFLMLGPEPNNVLRSYTGLTGRAQFPPMFAIAYHQCRWNYVNEADVSKVNKGFDDNLIPYDVLWLDIEHTDGKRYFTWDENNFPTPTRMQEELFESAHRRMVAIVDPHIKNDPNYYVHAQASELGMYIKEEDGKTDFHGWCWPGDSSYVDFSNPIARQWWSSLFHFNKYKESTRTLFIWNDMQEPSVFNGPEVSMRKSCLNIDGVEHREWHNLYGMYMQQATMDGLLLRQLPRSHKEVSISSRTARPFVLARSFFAGSQKFGAVWTGDNESKWSHLEYGTKMLLSMGVCGLSFVGSDVGGFFGSPSAELLTRWYQVASLQPFFRQHAHHDSSRREPWLFGEPWTSRMRSAIRGRYALLPYLYTLFHEAATSGTPVMRPLWWHFPGHKESFSEDQQFLVGKDLLVKAISTEGVVETSVFLPSLGSTIKTVWYHIGENYKKYIGGSVIPHIPAPFEYIPVFQRGGSIVPYKNRYRRSSALMKSDPVTLVVAMPLADSSGHAEATGELYIDDEETYAWQVDKAYVHCRFQLTKAGIKGVCDIGSDKFESLSWIEKITIYGVKAAFGSVMSKITFYHEPDIHLTMEFSYQEENDCIIIRKPGMLIAKDWEIVFKF